MGTQAPDVSGYPDICSLYFYLIKRIRNKVTGNAPMSWARGDHTASALVISVCLSLAMMCGAPWHD